jgi:acyl-CoA synthetase (AMP-forming)/AMP-acid ligase II
LQILTESDAPALAQELATAWSAESTFAVLPAKGRTRVRDVQDLLRLLPDRYRTKHFCMLTSGSTGAPNLVIGCRARSEQLVTILHAVQESEPVRQTIVALPLSYCYAFINQWLWALVYRHELVVTGGLADPRSFLASLDQAREAMLCLVGSQVPLLLKYADGQTYNGVIRLHFAGGRFPQEHIDELQRLFPNAAIFNNYGCAEAMPRLAIRKAQDADQATSVGRAIPGVKLSTSQNGEVLFRSPYRIVARFISGALEEIDDQRWLPTGDVGELHDDGQLWIMGRGNEVFKRYGEKISLAQIVETIASEWKGMIGTYREPDTNGEQGYVLCLCPQPTPTELNQLLMALRRVHPRPHWPLRIESLPRMPTLPNGKIDSGFLFRIEGRLIHWRQHI